MFCAKCGREAKEGTKFCMYCGAPLMSVPVQGKKPAKKNEKITPSKPRKEEPAAKPNRERNKKSKKIVGIVAGVGVLAAGLWVGGSFLCNYGETALAREIDDYKITDYTEQKDDAISDYEGYNFFDIVHKAQTVKTLFRVQSEAKAADADLQKQQKSYDQMNTEKEAYDLADSYVTYTDTLDTWSEALKNRDYQDAVNAASEAQTNLEQLVEDNKKYVQDKLDLYGSATWSEAEASEKKTYDEDVKKVDSLLQDGKYNEMKSLFAEMDDIAFMYIASDSSLNVQIQQVDVSQYPNIKLYVQMEDEQGEVPEDLLSNFFYVKREDANASYVRQKIAQVTQLNETEALKVNMVADVSGSMKGYPLDEAKELMNGFIDSVQFDIGDQIELTSFSTGVYLEQEFTDNPSLLKSCVDNLYTSDMTSLYDALYTAVSRTAPQNGAKCVIAFTDGDDNYSNCTPDQVIDIAKRYSVPIFIIGVGDVSEYNLRDITNQTGGEYYAIDDIASIKDVYDEIYKQEKELYMISYEDETGAKFSDKAKLKVGYHSKEYGGEANYSYTPKLLMSVDGNSVYTDGPEAVVEKYVKNFDKAMTNEDFSYISDYLKPGSEIYKDQKKYVKRGISELLQSYEIADVDYKDSKHCTVTTRETYYVQKPDEALKLTTQQCKYVVVLTKGEWKIKKFAENVKVLNSIRQ